MNLFVYYQKKIFLKDKDIRKTETDGNNAIEKLVLKTDGKGKFLFRNIFRGRLGTMELLEKYLIRRIGDKSQILFLKKKGEMTKIITGGREKNKI
jgi:hypothetical protein